MTILSDPKEVTIDDIDYEKLTPQQKIWYDSYSAKFKGFTDDMGVRNDKPSYKQVAIHLGKPKATVIDHVGRFKNFLEMETVRREKVSMNAQQQINQQSNDGQTPDLQTENNPPVVTQKVNKQQASQEVNQDNNVFDDENNVDIEKLKNMNVNNNLSQKSLEQVTNDINNGISQVPSNYRPVYQQDPNSQQSQQVIQKTPSFGVPTSVIVGGFVLILICGVIYLGWKHINNKNNIKDTTNTRKINDLNSKIRTLEYENKSLKTKPPEPKNKDPYGTV